MNQFNQFNNWDNQHKHSTREKLEITENGRSLADERDQQHKERQQNGYGRGGGGFRQRGPTRISINKKLVGNLIFWGFMIFVLFMLNARFQWFTLENPFAEGGLTSEESANILLEGVYDLDRQSKENVGLVEELTGAYEVNPIYQASAVRTQLDDLYMVYIYTGIPMADEHFNTFVEAYQEDIPIYTFDMNHIGSEDLGFNLAGSTPHIVIYQRVQGDKAEVKDVFTYDTIEEIIPSYNTHLMNVRENKEGLR